MSTGYRHMPQGNSHSPAAYFLFLSGIDYGMFAVLLPNTFQSSMPLLNAFFCLVV